MSFHCSCLEQLKKDKGLEVEFDIVFKIKTPDGFYKRMTYRDNKIRCPFCGSVLAPKKGRKK
jgi:hypothetical protein